ncbi:linear amide C-N hydrolase [Halomonas halocynthiae]|uniref:linear amide C-N hydrolase n=1 Tax=Halomonas halocynthiae TaxID=176290 RepID=UPI000412FF54|nr:linear amide C-N hydrolase [Halomonas halocynthiae]
MSKPNVLMRTLLASVVAGAVALPTIGYSCTSLLYTDANGAPYAGRTMELPMQLPYEATFFPKGAEFESKADGQPELAFEGKYSFISLTVPDPVSKDLKVVEGMNDEGLSFSVLAFASTKGPKDMVSKTTEVLAAIDLGAWALSQFKTVAEVKEALEAQPVLVTALLPLGILKTPFHYTLHDANGDSIVIEFSNGQQNVIDNPIGVMTNGPEFSWHMTNLNNYTFLDNRDRSTIEFNGERFEQPDSGIATVALPASNTSVGRFVRAVYYSQFAEKAKTPDKAVNTLAHVMNNFDRPRGITMDNRYTGEIENITAPGVEGHKMYTSEYTSWTALSDLRQLQFNVRSYDAMNYINFDLAALKNETEKKSIALSQVPATIAEGNDALKTVN